jgi:hypothetical protein
VKVVAVGVPGATSLRLPSGLCWSPGGKWYNLRD